MLRIPSRTEFARTLRYQRELDRIQAHAMFEPFPFRHRHSQCIVDATKVYGARNAADTNFLCKKLDEQKRPPNIG